MTTTTHAFSSAPTSARRPVSHGFWSDAGFGLAAVLVILTFAVAGFLEAGSRGRADAAWQTTEAPPMSGGFESGVPPEAFPLTGHDFDAWH